MATVYTEDTPSSLIAMNRQQFVQIFTAGAVVGLVIWGLSLLLDTYVYQMLLCRGEGGRCDSSLQYAQVTAIVLAALTGLFSLVRLQVFRPLLVVIAATVALWSLQGLTASLPWWYALLAVAGVYGVGYLLFAWLVRVRSFVLACVLAVVVVVITRLAING